VANNVRITAALDDRASKPLKGIRDSWKKFQREGSQGVKAGITAGATVKAFSLLDTAISSAVSWLGDAKRAYQEDAASQAAMRTSLQANVAGWDGNTDAIEKVIKSRMRLGFADDEQRAGLTVLTGVTHDATKALELQRVAMDLARFRGMDLATASMLVGKVYGGNVSILKRYGIQLDKNATSTEAIAAITKMAGGQAEAYATGPLGKELAAQIKVGESMERVGAVVSQVSAAVLPALADGLEGIVAVGEQVGAMIGPIVDGFNAISAIDLDLTLVSPEDEKAVDDFYQSIVGLDTGLRELVHGHEAVAAATRDTAAWQTAALAAGDAYAARQNAIGTASVNAGSGLRVALDAGDAYAARQAAVGEAATATGDSMRYVGKSSLLARDDVRTSTADIVAAIEGMRDTLVGNAQASADAIWAPEEARLALIVAEEELTAAKVAATASGLTRLQKAEADQRVIDAEKALVTAQANASTYGSRTAQIEGAAARAGRILKSAEYVQGTVEQKAALDKELRQLRSTMGQSTTEAQKGGRGVKDGFGGSNGIGGLPGVVAPKVNAVKSKLGELNMGGSAAAWSASFSANYNRGINFGPAIAKAGAAASTLRGLMHLSSPAKIGPMSLDGGPEGWGEEFSEHYAKGVQRKAGLIPAAVNSALGGINAGASGGVPAAGARRPMTSGTPVTIPVMLDGKVIAEVVDRHLYYDQVRAPAWSDAG
jgi:hypothetical protein